ncbi:MAG: error-prone DNA polymerase, partial [Candidatus Latescibacterota bacterium]
ERVFEQIRGFGDYGFPESHAASFAYIGYVSAWLKRHHPEVFVCALLNAWPMGFYSPATIIDDAKRHKSKILPVDVQMSRWECTLEERHTVKRAGKNGNGNGSTCGPKTLAVRVGLRYVKGLREDVGRTIEKEQDKRPFESIDDFITRTKIEDGALNRLAEAGAFERFDRHRRNALWRIAGHDRTTTPKLSMDENEPRVMFDRLSQFETIGWDYSSTGHSTRGHPLSPFREELKSLGLPTARAVTALPNGRRASYAGIVINRQRPGTAKGVVFMTLEDETGFVNIVVWRNVFKKYMVIAKTSSFLGVTGKIQKESGVTHLVAESLWDPTTRRKPWRRGSRDFH